MLRPASRQMSIRRRASLTSVAPQAFSMPLPPNVPVPRLSAGTLKPDEPRRRNSMGTILEDWRKRRRKASARRTLGASRVVGSGMLGSKQMRPARGRCQGQSRRGSSRRLKAPAQSLSRRSRLSPTPTRLGKSFRRDRKGKSGRRGVYYIARMTQTVRDRLKLAVAQLVDAVQIRLESREDLRE